MPFEGRHLSVGVLLSLAYFVGFRGNSQVVAVAVCLAESEGYEHAWNVNTDSHRSVDRGLWEINDYWHPDVSDQCAYNGLCNARAAFRISAGGTSWTAWATFNNGAYRAHVATVQAFYDAKGWREGVADIPRLFHGAEGGTAPGPQGAPAPLPRAESPAKLVRGESWAPLVNRAARVQVALAGHVLAAVSKMRSTITNWR